MNEIEQQEEQEEQEERKTQLEMARNTARMARQQALKAPKEAAKKAGKKAAKQATKLATRTAMRAIIWAISAVVGWLGFWGVIILLTIIIIIIILPGPLKFVIEKGAAVIETFSNLPPEARIEGTYTHQEAQLILEANGINIESTGNCSDINNKNCTSLQGIPKKAIARLIIIKKECDCNATVTGGTEIGHLAHGANKPVVDLKYQPGDANGEKLRNYLKANQVTLGIKNIIDAPHGSGPHIHLEFW